MWEFWKWGHFLNDLQVHLAVLGWSPLADISKEEGLFNVKGGGISMAGRFLEQMRVHVDFLQFNCHKGAYWRVWGRGRGYQARRFLRWRLDASCSLGRSLGINTCGK